MLGIARVRLEERDVEFFTLGTSEPVSRFALAPGGERAYALYSEIGEYEFWEFDLAGRATRAATAIRGPAAHGTPGERRWREALRAHVAGNTIDVYDAESFELLRTVEFDEDMTLGNVVVIPGPAAQ